MHKSGGFGNASDSVVRLIVSLSLLSKANPIELQEEFCGERTAHIVRLSIPAESREETEVPVVFFERQTILERLILGLRQEARCGSELAPRASARLGYALWSRLHRDLGTGESAGRFAALGNRKVFFKKFFQWLSGVSSPDDGDLWGVLASRGAGLSLPSFLEWKKALHFGGVRLPGNEDAAAAKKFLDTCAVSLAEAEERHRLNPRWAGADELPTEFWKWLRKDSTRLAREHGLSDAQIHAATLLSFGYRIQLGNHVAEQICERLPPGILNEAGQNLFKLMWLAEEVGLDERCRFDIPLMASPVLSSSVEYLADVKDDGVVNDKQGVLTDLVSLATGQCNRRPRGLDIALGFGEYFPLWLEQEREREREKTRKTLGLEDQFRDEVLHERDRSATPG